MNRFKVVSPVIGVPEHGQGLQIGEEIHNVPKNSIQREANFNPGLSWMADDTAVSRLQDIRCCRAAPWPFP